MILGLLPYATELGWRVFPVSSDARSPLIARGCHAASSDPETIKRWWRSYPQANVALACGPGSGVIGVDVDVKTEPSGLTALVELETEFGALPCTVTSRTPSGGLHFLFAYPDGPDPANRVGLKRYAADGSRRVYHGIDARAAGASLCLPPSSKNGTAYIWERSPFETQLAAVPAWLLVLMRSEPPPRPSAPPVRLSSTDRVARYVCAAIEGECAELAGMAPGSGRNQRLFIAAARLGELIGAGVLGEDLAEGALEQAATDCGLVREDGLAAARATIRSGLRRGVSNPREIAA